MRNEGLEVEKRTSRGGHGGKNCRKEEEVSLVGCVGMRCSEMGSDAGRERRRDGGERESESARDRERRSTDNLTPHGLIISAPRDGSVLAFSLGRLRRTIVWGSTLRRGSECRGTRRVGTGCG